jgi:nucleotide-binding universal stress UspA family protein
MTPIKTILHPTDFSEHAGHAFEMAGSLARDHGARLIVLHVIPFPLATSGGVEPLTPGFEELNTEAEQRQLAAIRSPDPGLRFDRRLIIGDPVAEILRAAAETRSDLIVMGTHGRTGLGRLLMGSVAEQVLRKAACPVLTVRHPFPGDEAPAAMEAKARAAVTTF